MVNNSINLTKEEVIKKRAENNIKLIYKPVQKFYNKEGMIQAKYDFEELLSVATLCLYKASAKFDETKGYKFSTYAIPIINFGLIEFTRKDKWYYDRRNIKGKDTYILVDRVSISTGLKGKGKGKTKDSSELTLEDSLEDRTVSFEDLDNKMLVDKLFETCTQKEVEILKGYFFEEKPQTQLALEFNTSQSYICVVIKRNLRKFKKILGGKVFEC